MGSVLPTYCHGTQPAAGSRSESESALRRAVTGRVAGRLGRGPVRLRLPARCHPSGFTGPAGKAVMGTHALTITGMTQAISWQSYFRLGVITSSTHARTSIASLSPVDGGALVVWLGCCSRTVVVICHGAALVDHGQARYGASGMAGIETNEKIPDFSDPFPENLSGLFAGRRAAVTGAAGTLGLRICEVAFNLGRKSTNGCLRLTQSAAFAHRRLRSSSSTGYRFACR